MTQKKRPDNPPGLFSILENKVLSYFKRLTLPFLINLSPLIQVPRR